MILKNKQVLASNNNGLLINNIFIDSSKVGAVYKADNWSQIGETAGLPKHKSVSMKWHNKEELKELYVKPTGENKKMIFIKTI